VRDAQNLPCALPGTRTRCDGAVCRQPIAAPSAHRGPPEMPFAVLRLPAEIVIDCPGALRPA
jgi:hypothetical protein